MTGEGHLRWTPAVTLTCEHCAQEFDSKPSESTRRRYCSTACVAQAHRERRRQECETCGASFIPAQARRQRFCSRDCASVAHRTAARGAGNGRYIHGGWETEYSLGFTAKLRAAVRERDRNRCVMCTKAGLILQVHHIDGSKDNHAPTNLVTVCLSCHHKVHTKIGINAAMMRQYGSLLYAAAALPMPSTTSASSRTTITTPTGC